MGVNKFWVELVLNDIHFPKQNKKAINCALKTLELLQPDGITLNGDICDWSTFSRHDRFHAPKCHWTDSQFYHYSKREYKETNKFLDDIQRISTKSRKRWLFSNHDQWLLDFIRESPKTRQPLFGFEERLGLTKRGYELYGYNAFAYLGKLRITHGIYTGQNHAKKHVEAVGKSILYGHLHDIQTYSKVTAERDTHMAFCNPCLCDMNPEYLKNRPQNWSHGFAVVYVYPGGDFQVDIKRIHNGKVIMNGKLIEG